jgi:hypothetical protein
MPTGMLQARLFAGRSGRKGNQSHRPKAHGKMHQAPSNREDLKQERSFSIGVHEKHRTFSPRSAL